MFAPALQHPGANGFEPPHHPASIPNEEAAWSLLGKRSPTSHLAAAAAAQELSPEAKKARIQNSMRILKDEPVPDGYIRFRYDNTFY